MTNLLNIQCNLMQQDLDRGLLVLRGFCRSFTMPSGKVVLAPGGGADLPGVPGHWQHRELRYHEQGLWIARDTQACLYRREEGEFWLVESWLPQMEVPREAEPVCAREGLAWFLPALVDYENWIGDRMGGLNVRLQQIRCMPPEVADESSRLAWMVQIGSHSLASFSWSTILQEISAT